MLDLHRASAGSGKTYTLAKKYIWYYLTISEEGGARRLRTDAELAESARHILAVTFTNKATNEMQVRIVNRLFDLAYMKPVMKGRPGGSVRVSSPDYMQDFIDDLHAGGAEADPNSLAEVSRKALAILLENYSDFNVSTIDSFFQLVLRTFAYESDLNDTYQVELDSEFLSEVGVDGTLEDIDSDKPDRELRFWIGALMDRTDTSSWNIFARNKKGFGDGPYKEFIDSVKKLENEEYKFKRDEIDAYFNHVSPADFIRLYLDLEKTYDEPVRSAFIRFRAACIAALEVVPSDYIATFSPNSAGGKLFGRLIAMRDAGRKQWHDLPVGLEKVLTPDFIAKGKGKEAVAPYPQLVERLGPVWTALEEWTAALADPAYNHWRLYSVNLPYLALFSSVMRKRQDYLNETNSVELGETSMILHGIIGDDDAPFIYERLGTYLNHFLIDEFQDTSRLQWENLLPLLRESMSRENDNLIIGDAKQSIYRFRNADPSLISSGVQEAFGDRVRVFGNRPEENTNYRSRLRVVQFNNSFFRYLVGRLDREASVAADGRMQFGPIYGNVAQTPFKRGESGYVEVCVGPRKQGNPFKRYLEKRIPLLIRDLLERGYRQKDIAVLVRTASEGDAVIQTLVEYNASLQDEDSGLTGPEIKFVSEQSLKLVSSRAVRIVTGVLENLARGISPQINTDEERLKKGVGKWAEMESAFKFFSMGREDLSKADLLDLFLASFKEGEELSAVLADLQSFAIPALVEAIVSRFVPEALRRRDAVYLAAFQDVVLEYCDSHPTDIGSFLDWWSRKSRSVSISSPENTDAVQVMTVHKSKGLEFDCVIIPYADWSMAETIDMKKAEWRWVRPEMVSHPDIELPPYIPVVTSADMANTVHSPLLSTYFDQLRMDRLNSAYVAFTRAGRELYVFAEVPSDDKKKKKSADIGEACPEYTVMGRYLTDFLAGLGVGAAGAEDELAMLPPDVVATSEIEPEEGLNVMVYSVGTREDHVENSGKADESDRDTAVLDDYLSVVPSRGELKYRQADLPAVIEAEDLEPDATADDETTATADVEPDEVDIDPRSEGNIKHAVLELVRVAEDLPRAIRHLTLTGLIDPELSPRFEAELTAALADPNARRWFDGRARVINERPILKAGQVSRRPDRILIYPDGHAEVVDYKFGKIDRSGKYHRQIGNYVRRLRETGRFTTVIGYIWYVNAARIEPV